MPEIDERQEYTWGRLDERDVAADPVVQFQRWFEQARAEERFADAMTLSTADKSGLVSARIILLKAFDQRGFVFYTNYGGRKAEDLDANPRAALTFFWGAHERQVRIGGKVARLSDAENASYFASRPREAQLAAWCSQQSEELESREQLEAAYADMERRFADRPVPVPSFWGGYRLRHDCIEFWQGREKRLNDRLEYRREGCAWQLRRLAP